MNIHTGKNLSDEERARRGRQSMLSNTEAAERLHQKPQTLAQWRSERKGPANFKIGRCVFYAEEDVDAFIAGQRRDPTVRSA